MWHVNVKKVDKIKWNENGADQKDKDDEEEEKQSWPWYHLFYFIKITDEVQ